MLIEDMKVEITSLLNDYSSEYDIENEYKARMLAFLGQESNPFSRDNMKGHFTASVWLLSRDHSYVLLTKHAKIGRWFQLGGHIESSDSSFVHACLREAVEESGITLHGVNDLFLIDIDIHPIPQNGRNPEHLHYDITLCFVVDSNLDTVSSKESLQLSWVSLDEIPKLSDDAALLRMIAKTKKCGLVVNHSNSVS